MCVSWLLQHVVSRKKKKKASLAVKTAKSRVNYVESREQLPGCSPSCTVGNTGSSHVLITPSYFLSPKRQSILLVIWELSDHSPVFFTPFSAFMSLQSLWLHLITSVLHLWGVGLEHWSHRSLWRFVLQRELVNAPQRWHKIKRGASRTCAWMFRKSSS